MGAPIAAFLTLVLSLLLLRRLVFRPVVPGMDANLLDGAAIAALNRDRKQQLEQRRSTKAAQELVSLPSTPQQAREHLKWLEQLSRGSAAERLQAMQEAQHWGDRRCLPLLRRGQRDATDAVARQAACALEAFRGEPLGGYRSAATTGSGKASLPRNVARMR